MSFLHAKHFKKSFLFESFINSFLFSVPDTDVDASLLRPPVPIAQQESNWPLLSVSKGFFEMAIGTRGAMTSNANEAVKLPDSMLQPVDVTAAGGAWVDEDEINLDEDGKAEGDDAEFNAAEGTDGEKGWDIDDAELDIPADLNIVPTESSSNQESAGFFVPPTKGTSIAQTWCNNSKLPVDHILAGSFETAMRLLHDQVGVVDFQEYKNVFMQTYARSRTCFTALPSLSPLYAFPCRNPNMQNQKNVMPAVGLKLNDLIQRLQKSYELTTNGKFHDAIESFRGILLSVPLLVVENKQEIAEAQQLIEMCREYIVGLQMELHRKEMPKDTIEDQKRVCEVIFQIYLPLKS